jgi:hypothetical protein
MSTDKKSFTFSGEAILSMRDSIQTNLKPDEVVQRAKDWAAANDFEISSVRDEATGVVEITLRPKSEDRK